VAPASAETTKIVRRWIDNGDQEAAIEVSTTAR
jgi:hypothetical protein